MTLNVWGPLTSVLPGHTVPTHKYDDLSLVPSVTECILCFITLISWAACQPRNRLSSFAGMVFFPESLNRYWRDYHFYTAGAGVMLRLTQLQKACHLILLKRSSSSSFSRSQSLFLIHVCLCVCHMCAQCLWEPGGGIGSSGAGAGGSHPV